MLPVKWQLDESYFGAIIVRSLLLVMYLGGNFATGIHTDIILHYSMITELLAAHEYTVIATVDIIDSTWMQWNICIHIKKTATLHQQIIIKLNH